MKNVIYITLLLWAIGLIALQRNSIALLRVDKERLEYNLLNANNELLVTRKEYKQLKDNPQIKYLIRYQEVIIRDTVGIRDTVPFNDTIQLNDTDYLLPFKYEELPVLVEGNVKTTDLDTKLFFEHITYNNEVRIFKRYRKSFWDKVFFRKGEVVIDAEAEYGNIEFKEINIID